MESFPVVPILSVFAFFSHLALPPHCHCHSTTHYRFLASLERENCGAGGPRPDERALWLVSAGDVLTCKDGDMHT